MKTSIPDDSTRGGRPALEPQLVRRNRTLRYTDAEWETLRRRAAEADCSLTEFLYAAATGRALPTPVPEVNQELFASLRQVGGNLNQISHRLNLAATGSAVAPSTAQVAEVLGELRREFRAVRAELLGRAP